MSQDRQLSRNFWLKEFTISTTADRHGISNSPGEEAINNLRELCETILQPARDALGPLRINSGYRSLKLNELVGGSKTSAHRLGHAADVFPLSATTRQFAEWVVLNCPKFDQVILEFGTAQNPNWIHVSSDPKNRKEVLRAYKKSGKTVYDSIDIVNEAHRPAAGLNTPPAVPDFRLIVANQILKWEARFVNGKLSVYELPSGDGGGSYEVGGINVRYHPEKALELKTLIEKGRFDEAEKRAVAYIADQTDGVSRWTPLPSVECFLRDSAFNRGLTGAAKIYQIALGVSVDGVVATETLKAAAALGHNPAKVLSKLREARETYERKWVGRSESSKFWKGLVNRWNNCLAFSQRF